MHTYFYTYALLHVTDTDCAHNVLQVHMSNYIHDGKMFDFLPHVLLNHRQQNGLGRGAMGPTKFTVVGALFGHSRSINKNVV